MASPINQQSEFTRRCWESQVEFENLVNPASPDAEAAAEVTRSAMESSAIRGLVFGLPLSLAMWGIPVAVWLATGSEWLGVAAGVAEFGLTAWLFWGRRGRERQP